MIHLELYETFNNKVKIGIDIDGTICNFSEGYNNLYKQYFPDKEPAINDNWFWYQQMDYNGERPQDWFNKTKAEVFGIAQPYPDAVETINNIFDVIVKPRVFNLNIITYQPTEESKQAAKDWINKCGFKFDEIIFVKNAKDKWNYADIMVDDADKVIGSKPLSKVSIKIDQLWNTKTVGDFNLRNIKALSINIIEQAINKLQNKTTL